ncbi:MAG: DNA mismatch repair protein MutS [Anaerolineae bacterium]|nr:DNA mismatch repair protein MutS [Anaerolineae bacterium]
MSKDTTPARRQYLEIKSQYPGCLLFFRMGDFYETFDEDALTCARELDLTLTSRSFSQKAPPVPMAGVPYHALESYVARLIERGFHVAVCDQMSEPTGRGIVEREVTRVITPGTIVEPELLAEDRPNYLLAVIPAGTSAEGEWTQAGIAYADITTGEFAATQLEGEHVAVLVLEELVRLAPREVLFPEARARQGISLPEGMHLTQVPDWTTELPTATDVLHQHFGVATLDGFGLRELPLAVCAAGALVQYLRVTQKNSLAQMNALRSYSTGSFMVLDPFTRRNLELTQTIRTGKTQGSLLEVLDHTVTAMGARLLRSWLNQPLLDMHRLNARLDAVEALTQEEALRQELRDGLKSVSDMERLVNRLLMGRATPRDLLGLRASLEAVPALQRLLAGLPALAALYEGLDACEEAVTLIAATDKSKGARDWIASLEPAERRRTGIPTIKVGFNRVFGYYIEVTQAQSHKVPADYIRRQTLVNAERYITPELKEYETLVLNAEGEILAVEKRIYEGVCATLGELRDRLLKTARMIAHLDVFLSLAVTAVREGYVRPLLNDSDRLIVKSGRHPVVEKLLKDTRYIANNTHFDTAARIHIITGPNMSGKSTYIRQVAILTLLAQIGSFVPADEAEIGLVDRIFARIGAQDEIHAGQSTFMVEMVETARLLSGSTRRSLLILDEIGRGTSTYDGLAIARAVIEYIHNNPRLNCRTLFATHYHELTELPNILPRAKNYSVAVTEKGDDVIFLHKVVAGGADRSYGIHVAGIAGMPRPVVERARELLALLESRGSDFKLPSGSKNAAAGAAPGKKEPPPAQLSFLAPTVNPALEALRKLEVDSLSPLEALTKLYELKRMAGP